MDTSARAEGVTIPRHFTSRAPLLQHHLLPKKHGGAARPMTDRPALFPVSCQAHRVPLETTFGDW
jgi:hypothetical protein